MDKTYLGRRLAEFSPGIASQPITKVELLDENGDVVGVSGSDTGRTLTALQPDGTNAMAAAILAKVSGYKHIGYEGSEALLDPAVELGDAVTVDGIYVPLIALDTTFDPMLAPNISSPDADEIDDEYPYKSPTQRQIERNMAKTRSLITKTSEEIMLKVEGVDGRVTSLSTSIDGIEANISSLNGSITNITADINGLRTTVSGKIDGSTAQSMIDQSIDKITLKVEGIDGKYTEVKTTLDGLTVTDQSGTTKIKGSSIETTTLKVSSANITGTLTIGQLPSEVAQKSQIPTQTSQLCNDSGYQTELGVTTIINGTVTTDYIYALGVEASTLRGSTIALKDGNNTTIGGFTLADTTTSTGLGMTTTWGGIKIQPAGNIFLQAGTGGAITIQNGLVQLGSAALCLATASFGTSAPSGAGVAGQLYIQLVS